MSDATKFPEPGVEEVDGIRYAKDRFFLATVLGEYALATHERCIPVDTAPGVVNDPDPYPCDDGSARGTAILPGDLRVRHESWLAENLWVLVDPSKSTIYSARYLVTPSQAVALGKASTAYTKVPWAIVLKAGEPIILPENALASAAPGDGRWAAAALGLVGAVVGASVLRVGARRRS